MREVVGIKVSLEFIKEQQNLRQKQHAYRAMINERINSNKLYKIAYLIQESSLFRTLIILSIIVNTVILSLDKYPENIRINGVMEKMNLVFTGIFTFEMFLRLFSMGFKIYFKSHWFNFFDAVIVISSLIDITIAEVLIND